MLEEIAKYDKDFSEGTFLTKVDHIFIMILDAIMDNDMSSVKHFLSEDIYLKYEELTKEYSSKGYTRIFDEMNVKSTQISDYKVDENNINVEVILTSRYMDYFLDSNGEYVSGENTRRIEKNHFITFTKKLNAEKYNEIRRCPGCGASVNVNENGKCKDCGTIFNASDYDYIITKMAII